MSLYLGHPGVHRACMGTFKRRIRDNNRSLRFQELIDLVLS
jgi:hypothetical protein